MPSFTGRGTRLYALTNWSEETFEESRAGFPFLDWFIDVMVSGREGMAKPDERIFRVLLDRFGLDPSTTVYLDDSPANVEQARKLGMDAIHVHSTADLRTELRRRGLLG